MTFKECVEAVEDAARQMAMAAPDVATGKGKAFEVWALLSIARHLSNAKLSVSAVGCDDMPVSIFIARGGPGLMPSAGANPSASPSHIVVGGASFAGQVELHLGLQHLSRRGVSHELDLSALPRQSAHLCRANGGGYYRGPLTVAVELKAYDNKYKLDQGVARALLGTMVDLEPWRTIDGIYLDLGGDCHPAWSPIGRCAAMHLVTTTQLYENSKTLLDAHGGSYLDGVSPKRDWKRLKGIAEDVQFR